MAVPREPRTRRAGSLTAVVTLVAVLLSLLLGAGGGWALATGAAAVPTLPVATGARPVVVPIRPCRLVDTRPNRGVGPRRTPLGANQSYTVTATGAQGNCTVPIGALGLVLNVTAVRGTSASFLTVWPTDKPRPFTSNLNWVANQAATPNQVTVGLSTSGVPGQLSFYNSTGSVDLAVDVVAYLADHTFDDRYYTQTQTQDMFGGGTSLQKVATLHWYANQVASVGVGNFPRGIAFDGADMWVANYGDGTVTKLRAADGAKVGTFAVGSHPSALAFDGFSMWVVNSGDGTVTRLRASDGNASTPIHVGTNPVAVAFDGQDIWVVNQGSDDVTKINPVTGAVEDASITVGNAPSAIAFDGINSVWVTNSGDGTVQKIRVSDDTATPAVLVGGGPSALAFDGGSIWVTNQSQGTVSKVRVTDGKVLGTYPAGASPSGIAFDGTSLWVANSGSGTVTHLQMSDGTLLGTSPVGTNPTGVAFDGTEVWVTNQGSSSVNKL